jgi:dehydrogenase/reductase SDR family protein 7
MEHNIQISLICPGPVNSEIFSKIIQGNIAHNDPATILNKSQHGSNTVATSKHIEADGKNNMATDRCSYLTLKGLYYGFDEMWVTGQPFLAVCYLYDHAPWLGRQLMKYLLGPMRMNALKEGRSLFDIFDMMYHHFF